MKVLQINTVCGTGSTGKIATDLYEVLENQGHDCRIAFGRGNAPENIKTIKIGSDFSVNIHGVLTRITDKHGFYSTRPTNKLISEIEVFNPDIIHLHNIHGYFLNIETLFNYLKETNKPVIWTLHDCWSFTGHCTHFDYIGCKKWLTECYECPQKNKYPSSFFIDNSKINYINKKKLFTSIKNMTIITPSKWLAEQVEESFFKEYPLRIINNGIDLNIFRPTESDFRKRYGIEDKFIIVGVANVWDERKGLNIFLELSRVLDDNYQIVLVGLSDKQIKTMPRKIISISRTSNVNELVEIYSASDVLVNPSVEETMGLVTVEALACGIPVVLNNATALPEFIDESCGFIVEKYNIESFVEAIKNCKENRFATSDCLNRAKQYNKLDKYKEYLDCYLNINKQV